MIVFTGNHLRENRSLVWLTVGSIIALVSTVFAVIPGGLRLSSNWYDKYGETTNQPPIAETSKSIDPTGRVRQRRSRVGSEKTARGRVALGAETQPGQDAGDRDSVNSRANTSKDDDETLFLALEKLERRMAAAIARARESVVALEYTAPDSPPGTRRVATGVVINHRGEVLSVRIDQPPTPQVTAARNSSLIVARDVEGRRHSVHWVATDSESGLTLLRLPPRVVRPIRMAAGGPNLGSQVFVVGNPFGMGHSVSRGHVAGLDRALELGTRQLGGLIQIQAPIYPGDSGAAVVNLQGDWLGLIRSGLAIPGSEATRNVYTPSAAVGSGLSSPPASADILTDRPERVTDFGFAIPVRDVLWVADQLRTCGRVDRAYLGVRLEPLTVAGSSDRNPGALKTAPEIAGAIVPGLEGAPTAAEEGAILQEVLTNTPASQAGLRRGDGIVELDGQPIRSAHDLTDRLDRIPARTTILLVVVRDRGPHQTRISLSLQTASRPEMQHGSLPAPAVTVSANTTASRPLPDSPSGSEGAIGSPSERPQAQTRVDTQLPPPQGGELRITLPRAIVERLEKLEHRLEKLESFPGGATDHITSPNRQISSARKP